MTWRTLPQSLGVDVLALKAAAFELSPDPAMVVDADGALVAVNEAAEALFGQGLGLLARGRFSAALPPGSALVSSCPVAESCSPLSAPAGSLTWASVGIALGNLVTFAGML